MKTIVLNNQQQSELEQIFNELVFSLKKTYSSEDLLKLTSLILKESGKQTFQSKKYITIKTFQSLGRLSGKAYSSTLTKIKDYQKNGFQNEFTKDFDATKSFVKKSPDNIKNLTTTIKDKSLSFKKEFLDKSKNEKIEMIAVGIMSILIFSASAGGADFEGGIPDSDLSLGIGFHRHIVSHSIIMGLFVEFLMRAGVEVIDKTHKNLPSEHHKFWDTANNFINEKKGIAIGAMWAGISVHLLKDSGIFGHGMKPYTGIPIELSQEAHQGLFASNGTASAIFGIRK